MEKPTRRWTRWTKKKRSAFLDMLAETANVKAASAAVEVTAQCAYRLRRKDAAFAEAWHEALLAGYEMLETELLAHMLSGGAENDFTRPNGSKLNVRDVMYLLKQHRESLQGKWRGGRPIRRADPEDTNRAILKKLEAIDRARAAEREGD